MKYFVEHRTLAEIEESIQEMENKLISDYTGKGSVSFYQMMAETYRLLDNNTIKDKELFGSD